MSTIGRNWLQLDERAFGSFRMREVIKSEAFVCLQLVVQYDNSYKCGMLIYWILLPFCFRVTKGVQSATAGVQSAAQFVPSRQALTAFAIMIAAGSFFIFMAFFMFLPVIVLVPQKFAISFTIGCIFMVGSFFALKGPKAQFYHMISKEVNTISNSIIFTFISWSSISGGSCMIYVKCSFR